MSESVPLEVQVLQLQQQIEQLTVEKTAMQEALGQMMHGNTQMRAATIMQANQINKGNQMYANKVAECVGLAKKLAELGYSVALGDNKAPQAPADDQAPAAPQAPVTIPDNMEEPHAA